MRFFFYGTLMDPDVLALVVGGPLPEGACAPAMLAGVRRVRVRGKSFPMLQPNAGGSVDGVVVEGFDRDAAIRVTWFESDGYDIVRRRVVLADGRAVRAWVYMPRPGALRSGGSWDFGRWQRRDKPAYLARLAAARGSWRPTARELAAAAAAWDRRR